MENDSLRVEIISEVVNRVERLYNVASSKGRNSGNNWEIYEKTFGDKMTLHMDIDYSGLSGSDLLKLLVEPHDTNFINDIKLIVNNINRGLEFYGRKCRLNSTWYDSIPKSNHGNIGQDLHTIEA